MEYPFKQKWKNQQITVSYENNACENKNLVFTGSCAKELQENQYFPYDSLALHNITLLIITAREGEEALHVVFLNFERGLSFRDTHFRVQSVYLKHNRKRPHHIHKLLQLQFAPQA